MVLVGVCISALLLASASLFVVIRNPFSDDPFTHFHLGAHKWLQAPWIAVNRLKAQESIVHTTELSRSIGLYQSAIANRSERKIGIGTSLFKVPSKTIPNCFDVEFSPMLGTGFTIPAKSFEDSHDGVCRSHIGSAQMSDDRRRLAIQIGSLTNDFAATVWVYELQNDGLAVLEWKLNDATITLPSAFLADNTVAFKSKGGRSISCAVFAKGSGDEYCYISQDSLGENRQVQQIYRDRNSEYLGVLVSKRGEVSTDAFLLPPGKPFRLAEPIARQVVDFALFESSVIYSKEAATERRYESLLKFFRYDVKTGKTADHFAVPFYRSAVGRRGNALYVVHAAEDSGVRTVTKLTNSVTPLNIGSKLADVDAETAIYLERDRDDGVLRLLIKTSSGDTVSASLGSEGALVTDKRVPARQAYSVQGFEARSSDDAMVPCKFVAPKNSTFPLPTIAHAYGAYGSTHTNDVSPMMQAIMSNGIGHLLISPRGDGDKGANWTADGRPNKRKTVEDTQACVMKAVDLGYVAPGKILMHGRSAGAIPAVMTALRIPNVVIGAWVDAPFLDVSGRTDNTKSDDIEFGALDKPDEALHRLENSPYHNLLKPSANSGRFLFTCGGEDKITPVWQCLKGYAAIKTAHPNKYAQQLVMHSRGHYWDDSADSASLVDREVVLSFVLQTLKP